MQSVVRKILSLLLKLPQDAIIRSIIRETFIGEVISERVVEYPFVFRHLDIPVGSRVLDVGCCFSLLSLQLASLGYNVYGVDIEEYPYTHPNFKFFRMDICKTHFPDEYFDGVIAVSTIEHIGIPFSFTKLNVLKRKTSKRRDLEAMKEIRRILKSNGLLIMTVPFGNAFVETISHRIYDEKELDKILEGFRREKVEFYIKKEGRWIRAHQIEAKSVKSSDGIVRAVACIKARKIPNASNNNVPST